MFDPTNFSPKFNQFLDGVLPAEDDNKLLTIDAMADVLRIIREFLNKEQVPDDFQAGLAESVIRSWLRAKGPTATERVEMQQKFSVALGFDIKIPR